MKKEYTVTDWARIAQLLPVFIQMTENDLGEEEHDIPQPLTADQYQEVEAMITKLHTCNQFVDLRIFQDTEPDAVPEPRGGYKVKFFMRGDEEATPYSQTFRTEAEYNEWREMMGGSAEIYHEEGEFGDE